MVPRAVVGVAVGRLGGRELAVVADEAHVVVVGLADAAGGAEVDPGLLAL